MTNPVAGLVSSTLTLAAIAAVQAITEAVQLQLIVTIGGVVLALISLVTMIITARKVAKVEGVVNSKATIAADAIEALKAEVARLNASIEGEGVTTPTPTTRKDSPLVTVDGESGHVSVAKTEPEGG